MSDAIAESGAVLSTRARPNPPNPISAMLTLAWRAMLKIKHVPFQLFDVTVMPIMFTLLFTSMFSGALEQYTGGHYARYLLPGILVQTIIFITVYTGVGLNSDIHKGLFDRFRSLPMWQPAPIMGALVGDLFRYSVASGLILIVGVLVGYRTDQWWGVPLAFLLVLAFAMALSWIWIIFGMKVKTPESVMTTSFIFLMPLTFMSDIFVPLGTLPEWLKPYVAANPVSHLAAASRALMNGDPAGFPLADHAWWVLAWTLGITLVFAPLALWLYRKER